MSMAPTERLTYADDHCLEAGATVLDVRSDALAFDRSCFYPGGGGQPPDCGCVDVAGERVRIESVAADGDGVLWHRGDRELPAAWRGASARLWVDGARRHALSRHHTVLHVLNTLALREYGGWITGAQIGMEHSRIDFKLEGFSAALVADLEQRANAVLASDHVLTSRFIPESEFRARDDLRRTLEAEVPVLDGRVRVVAIEGFDAQACGGTHVRHIGEVGRLTIYRTENKGRINRRLYVRLAEPG